MPFKYTSYGESEDFGRKLPAMERNAIIYGSSIESMSEDFYDPHPESSSPGNGPSSPRHSTPECTPLRDVWLGQKYLESIIALQLHLQAGTEDIVPGLESKLKANLQDFPFSQCCTYLHNNGASGNFDPGSITKSYQNTLLSWIGHVAHERMAAEENLIRNAISNFVNPNPLLSGFPLDESPHVKNESPPAHSTGSHGANGGSPSIRIGHQARHYAVPPRQSRHPPTQNGSTSTQNGNPVTQSTPSIRSNGSPPAQGDLAKYTSLLKEKGDHYGETPNWIFRDIGTTDHPCFSCRVTFQGVTAEGSGRQKQFAKNEASFQACQQLDFQLS